MNCRFNKYLSALSFFNPTLHQVHVTFSDGHEIFYFKLRCGYNLKRVQHCQHSCVLVNNGSSDTTMLYTWMSTNLIFWTENTINLSYFFTISLWSIEINLFYYYKKVLNRKRIHSVYQWVHNLRMPCSASCKLSLR